MQTFKTLGILLSLVCFTLAAHSQKYRAGDKVQVLLNGKWTSAVIVAAASTDNQSYRVRAANSIVSVTVKNLKPVTVLGANTNGAPVQTAAPVINNALLGRYQIYTGIQKNYIGHFFLKANGQYQVALSSDEDTYASGVYEMAADGQSVKWLSGLFFHNHWAGKLTKAENGNYQIIFSGKAMAEKSDN